jgi:hypothetical protein
MVPHLIKKGEHLIIEGVEYVVVAVKKLDAPFYEAEIEPFIYETDYTLHEKVVCDD